MKKFYIGADVSIKTLDCVLYDANTEKMTNSNHIKITNDFEGSGMLLKWIKDFGISKGDVIVCMEHTGRYSYDFAESLSSRKLDFCMIPATKIKGAFAGARGKNDKVDAVRIAKYAYRYRDEITPMSLKDENILKLRDLANDRKMLVKDISSRKAIMTEYKNKQDDGRYRRAKEGAELLSRQLKEVEQETTDLIEEDDSLREHYKLLISIPGISLVNAVNLLIFTDNFRAFNDARKFAAYCGVAPFEYTSGTSINKGTHVSKIANRSIKADLSMAAKTAVRFDASLREYYQRKRDEGKSYGCVLNAVKFKLISKIFAVIRRGSAYVDVRKDAA